MSALTGLEIKPFTRTQMREMRKKGVDLLDIMSKVSSGGDEIPITADQVDVILDTAFPEADLESVGLGNMMILVTKVLDVSFKAETEKN